MLALTSFQSWVLLVNNVAFAFAYNDLAILRSSFNTTLYFHNKYLYILINQCLYVIRPFVMSYWLISTITLSPGKIRI
jgi:hypothetical protein